MTTTMLGPHTHTHLSDLVMTVNKFFFLSLHLVDSLVESQQLLGYFLLLTAYTHFTVRSI